MSPVLLYFSDISLLEKQVLSTSAGFLTTQRGNCLPKSLENPWILCKDMEWSILNLKKQLFTHSCIKGLWGRSSSWLVGKWLLYEMTDAHFLPNSLALGGAAHYKHPVFIPCGILSTYVQLLWLKHMLCDPHPGNQHSPRSLGVCRRHWFIRLPLLHFNTVHFPFSRHNHFIFKTFTGNLRQFSKKAKDPLSIQVCLPIIWHHLHKKGSLTLCLRTSNNSKFVDWIQPVRTVLIRWSPAIHLS